MNPAQLVVTVMCLPAFVGGTWRCVQSWQAARRLLHQDQALGVANSGARTPPAAGKAAPAPQASPRLAAPPPGHQPRCALCGWHRTWRDCCGWVWVAEICPAHEQRKATP